MQSFPKNFSPCLTLALDGWNPNFARPAITPDDLSAFGLTTCGGILPSHV